MSAFPKKEIESLIDSLGEFLKAFDQANKVSQIPLPEPKFEIGKKQKTNCSVTVTGIYLSI